MRYIESPYKDAFSKMALEEGALKKALADTEVGAYISGMDADTMVELLLY